MIEATSQTCPARPGSHASCVYRADLCRSTSATPNPSTHYLQSTPMIQQRLTINALLTQNPLGPEGIERCASRHGPLITLKQRMLKDGVLLHEAGLAVRSDTLPPVPLALAPAVLPPLARSFNLRGSRPRHGRG